MLQHIQRVFSINLVGPGKNFKILVVNAFDQSKFITYDAKPINNEHGIFVNFLNEINMADD